MNMFIFVITFCGKGESRADNVDVKAFESIEDAISYIRENTCDGKYWKHSSLLSTDYVYDTHRGSLFEE